MVFPHFSEFHKMPQDSWPFSTIPWSVQTLICLKSCKSHHWCLSVVVTSMNTGLHLILEQKSKWGMLFYLLILPELPFFHQWTGNPQKILQSHLFGGGVGQVFDSWSIKEKELEQKCTRVRNSASCSSWGVGYTQSSHVGIVSSGCSPTQRSFWNHRFMEPQAASLLSVCLIASWTLWPAISHGKEFHSSIMPGERNHLVLFARYCHLPVLFPAPWFLTTAVSFQHLKDNCDYKYLPHTPAQSSLYQT